MIAVLMGSIGTAGCGLLALRPAPQGGSPSAAKDAAQSFLTALAAKRATEGWAHLSIETKATTYDDDFSEFAHDVSTADWDGVTWEVATVIDLDISWGVHLDVAGSPVPAFLLERGIVAGGQGGPIVMNVQLPAGRPYLIDGQGLDVRQ